MISNSNKQNNHLITTSILLALSIICYGSLFYLVKANEKKILVTENNLSAAKRNDIRITSEKSVLNSTEQERSLLDKYFIDQNSIVVFIEKLESLALISGGRISLNSVDVDKTKKNLLKANFSVSGRFDQVFYFLTLLESLPFEINIKAFSLNKGGIAGPIQNSKGSAGDWTGSFNIELLSFINPVKQ